MITTLKIVFDIPLLPHKINKWRGAIAQYAGWEDDRFHNHKGAKEIVLYRYPSIQYCSEEGKAAIFAFGQGVEAIMDLDMGSGVSLMMDGNVHALAIDKMEKKKHPLSMPIEKKPYFLKNWLALNADNFKEWDNMTSLTERTQKLEQILASNIISFAKGIKWQLPQRLEVTLLHIRSTHTVKHKNIPMVAFDVSFSVNIDLPDGLGLGKACSHGFGVLSPSIEKKEAKESLKRPRLRKVLS